MTTRKKIFYGWWVLVALVVVGALGPMTRYSIPAFFPILAEEFGWSRSLIGTAQSISLWVYSFFSILTGLMIDRIGGRKTILIGGAVCLVGWLLLSSMDSVWQLFLYYGFVMGVAISFTHLVCVQAVSRKWFISRGGLAGGIVGSAFAAGTSVFSPLLTSLASEFGWRAISMVTGIVSSVVIIALAYFVIRDTPESIGLHPDGKQMEITEPKTAGKGDNRELFKALKTRNFWLLFISYSLTGIVFNGIMGHLVVWGVDLGSTAAAAGIFITLFNGPSIAARVLGGAMGDRFGKKKILIVGTTLSLGVVLAGLLGISSPVTLAVFTVVLGLAAGFANTLFAPYLGDLYGRKNVGSLFGILTLGWGLIGGVGPLLWGWVYDWTGSYTSALVLSSVCYAAALLITLFVRPSLATNRISVRFENPPEESDIRISVR